MGIPFHSLSRAAISLTLLTATLWSVLPLPVQAQYTPPDRGLPGRREGGGTRGNGCATSDRPLTALAPQFVVDGTVSIYGTTVSETPKLYWYVPAVNAQALEFVLLDEDGDEVYLETLPANETPGIVGVEVPAAENSTLSRLTPNQDYHWFFSVVCDTSDRSGDVISEGWVRRIPAETSLEAQLTTTPPTQHAGELAQAGVWFDALNTAAQQRCLQPEDMSSLEQWNTLLGSIGLENLTDAPLLESCPAN
ncbi:MULTISPECIES: DUF928 domain-containing protein [unclassified Leptolyngbya]|uniref:DUF928 domain-containing protein n=1 Tax=unclassified Leptolyngbya TaxID=2650499 RepID=UPI00168521CA|nr:MULTISPECIES: DUF928 domain-containing protein [unclassified Leptolyngbya]MBD1913448.1 DUF928 domain-containing protein [Leptolyngbya sp. FACHB-8]MBD2155843.1 DUF928 domain-containing protein [Leptolyngbya sp. FACHB-16]